MGVELHITRAESWTASEDSPITEDEWMAYVATDPELRIKTEFGKPMIIWLGESKYSEPWLQWKRGNVSTKWPDTALYRKMLKIAAALGARIVDDDDTTYTTETDWDFDPDA
jgi:hypothetical protein